MAGVPVAGPFDPIARVHDPASVGASVRIRGWVQRARSSGGILFLQLRDRTGSVPVTIRKDRVGPERFQALEHVQIEGTVSVHGAVVADPRAPGGREVRADAADVLDAGAPFPIFVDQTEEFLLDKRHLAIRSQDHVATFRLKAELLGACRRYLEREEVLETTPPIITGNPAEGGAEAFQIEYFGRPGYLSQTAQLYLEALLAPHERVYAITPSFRAEKSRTSRHLTEYTHLEVELAWTDLDGLVTFLERMLVDVLHDLAERRPQELQRLGRPPEELRAIEAPFRRIRYAEAIETLQASGFPVAFGSDLGTAEERALTLTERSPIFLTHFPKEIKAFYMLESPGDPRTVEAADLLAPEGYGEIAGASARETDVLRLTERLRAIGAPLSEYEWYLDLRRHGSVPHAGFGLGVERILRWVLRREHIRDTTPFPRTPARHTP
ncbi:MAG TPA: asparagine--tRNA ligase [Thermoplasmata archaeon]|nr:asparagine--tRNA ligase [Thermoplasmata archaeon]